MAKYSNTVEYNINTKLDSSGLTKLQAQIKQLENSMQQMSNRELIDEEKVRSARSQLEKLNTALTNSFNSSLGILDLSKFRAELDASGVSAAGLQSAFNMMGAEGQAALNGLTTQIANFNGGMERTSSAIDKVFTTFSNTFRWGLISSFFSNFMNSIHQSVDYVKELDDSLTQIMLVTDYNRDAMNQYAKSANEAAKSVSMTTTGMTNASLVFAQQGYNLNQSQELATLSAKLANASQQDTATTSDQITAYMNAYGLQNSMEELAQQMDNWALIANVSAADVSELAQASQRAASMANTVGVSGEQLAAQIATIESVTREAPEQIGNGLKTLYARFSDISQGGEDEDGVKLGDVTRQLNNIGVQVLDQFGNIRDIGDIMEDLMVVWDDLDQTSKIAAAQSLAGKYQVNRFVSLMDNSDMYREYLGATGSSAAGTLDQMNQEYADSIAGRSAKLQASLEGLFSTIFNTDDIYPWMDAAQGAVDLLQQFFDALGGGKTVLLGITSLLTQAFSQNIARNINDTIANRNLSQIRQQNINTVGDTLDRVGIDRTQGVGAYIDATAQQAKLGALSDAQYDAYMNNVQQWADASTALAQSEEELTNSVNAVNLVFGKVAGETEAAILSKNGLNTFSAAENRASLSNKEIMQRIQGTDFSDVAGQAQVVSIALKEVQSQFNTATKDSEELGHSIDWVGDQLHTLSSEMNGYSSTSADNMIKVLQQMRIELDENGKLSETSAKQLQKYIREMQQLSIIAANMDETSARKIMADAGDSAQKIKSNVDFNRTQEQRANQNAITSQANIDSQQQIKNVLDTLNAVQQLTFAWQAFQNLGSLWANEDLSTGEKVLQTIMNLTMAMPQLISAMQTLQGNSFLQNIGGELLNLFNGNSKIEAVEKGLKAAEEMYALKSAMDASSKAQEGLTKFSQAFNKELAQTVIAGAEAKKTYEEMGNALLEQMKAGTEAQASLGAFSKALLASRAAMNAGESSLAAMKIGFATLKAEIAATMASLGPFLLVGAAIAAIAIAIGQAQEQAKQAHEEALAALEDAKNAQQQAKDLSSSIEEWESKRDSQGENKKLAQEADELSRTMRELGADEQASAVHLAALRAEANSTAENFDILAQAINNAQTEMSNQAYLDTMNAANEILKDQLSTEEEIAAAREDMKNAALDYNLNQISQVNGSNMGILGVTGDNDLRAATADWQSLDALLKEAVPGFKDITDENERLALALSHTSDEALRAGIQIEQLLNANSSLSDARIIDYGAGDIGTINERENITQQLQTAGFSAQESLQLLATLDKDASMAEISERIAEIQSEMELNGNDFDLALKGTLSEEDAAELTKNQISSFEAIDEDIDTEEMQDLAEYIRTNAEELDDFSDSVALDAKELAELSEEILRYDDALQTAQDSMEKWEDMLTSGATQDAAEATKQLADTYNDLLDVGEGASVSADFAGDIDNLNLLKAAIEGDEEAYTELQRKAAEDIILNIATNDEAAQAAFDKVWAMINEVDGYYAAAEVGAELDDGDFIAALEEMINAAGMTADQATAALSAMGVDAEIESETDTEETPATAIGLTAIPYTESITGQFPVANLGETAAGAKISLPTTQSFTASFPAVRYEPQEVDASSTMALTGFSLKTTSGGKSSGGNLSIKSAKKGNTGGSKFRNASHGGGASGGGGGGGKGSCFVAGTPISMLGYYKNIEKIQVNDIVLSYNEQTKKSEFSQVLQTMIHDVVEPIYTLYIKNEQLKVTGIHRFLVVNNIINLNPQWICAEDLHIGQWVLFADGTWHVIHKIEVNIEHQIVYNFEVSNNHNYYVGYNQILAHNKGGGGGGGKAKTIEPKEKKDHQKDYYEEVNSQLDKTEKILSKIEKEEDRLIGDKARANQNKQLELLQKEIDLNKEKQKIQQQELEDIDARIKEQDKLAESIAKTGGVYDSIPDAVFDEDGIITNYEEISAAIDNIHNKLIDKYNAAAAAGNEDLTKSLSKTIEKFDKYGEDILKSVQRHDKLQSEIEGTINELEQLQDAIEDVRIDAWKASTEAIDNLKDLRETAAELEGFFSEYESDSPFRDLIIDSEKLNNIWSIGKDEAKAYYDEIIADKEKALKATTNEDERAAIEMSIDYFKALKDNVSDSGLNNGLLGLAYQDMLQLKEWFENPDAADNPFGQNTSALRDAYEEAYKKVADMAEEYEKQVEDFRDDIIDAYDDIEDRQNRQIDKFDRVVEKLEKFSDMYALYYGDESYDMLRDTLQQQGNTLREQLNLQKELYSYWADKYAEAIEIGDEKLMNELEDKMNDAEDKMAELAEDAAKAFADSYENAVKASTQHIIQDTIGDKNFDRLDRNWEWDKDYIDKYRDNVEKAYEMDKLRNKYTDLLNQAQGASLQTQDKIRAQMQEQLALLDGQATVSEYDVKLANAKLEILQKQIALEDAQRNKNQMKLRRDTQGNYRYVYTANQDDVDKAQQELLDSEYDAYELSKNQQISNYDNLINAYQKYLSQREEILNNANLNEEEKMQQNQELYDKFLKVVNAAKEDFSDAAYGTLDVLNWLTLNGTDYTTTAATKMLNNLLDEQGNIKDKTGQIWMDNATYLTKEVIPKISEAVGEADSDIEQRLADLKENMIGDNGVIPFIVNGIEGEDGLTSALDSARSSTDGLVVATRDLMEALNGDNSALAEAQAQLQNYLEELNNVKNASSITAQQLRDTQKELDKSQAESLNYKTQLDDLASGKKVIRNGKIVDPNAEKKNGGSGSKSSTANSGKAAGVAAAIWIDGGWASGWGDGWERAQKLREKGVSNAQDILNRDAWSGKIYDDWYGSNLKPYYYGSFKSGGYTGEWAGMDSEKNGKLAFLHQKELILNAEDTQNILTAVDIVRQIGTGLRNSAMNIGNISGKNLGTIGDTIEQRVEINASFPNATDAEDIRQALIGLSDKAYQYAHRNR